METFRFAIGIVLGMALPYAVQRWDRARLSPAQREAAWNVASWGAALYAFGPLSMLGWAWVTRGRFGAWRRRDGIGVALARSFGVLLAGVVATAALGGVIVGVDAALEALTGRGERETAPR